MNELAQIEQIVSQYDWSAVLSMAATTIAVTSLAVGGVGLLAQYIGKQIDNSTSNNYNNNSSKDNSEHRYMKSSSTDHYQG